MNSGVCELGNEKERILTSFSRRLIEIADMTRINVNVVCLFETAPRDRDWSNQERAEFYRVENSLIRAGLPVETDRGLSDEGDPWFVFCHAETGDIIIHFARFDGSYAVASSAFDRCMRGADFRSFIEALSAGGRWLKERREACGLSQRQLADKVGADYYTYPRST